MPDRLTAALVFGLAAVAPACTYDYQAAKRCSNGVKDGDETDVDCGASCIEDRAGANDGRCAYGKSCIASTDCDETVARCELGRCTPLKLTAKWRLIRKGTPPSRLGARLSFRGAQGFLIGGFQKEKNIAGHALQEMWIFSGKDGASAWHQYDMDPAARYYHAQAFDPILNAVIIAGGETATSSPTDTWAAKDEQNWSKLDSPLPEARAGALMVHDGKDRLILYGEGDANEIWVRKSEWESKWARVQTDNAPPDVPYHHAMAYDAAHDQVVVFGGCVGSCGSGIARTAVLDLSVTPPTWQQPNVTGPIARWGSAAAYDPYRQRVVLFGGRSGNETRFNDSYEWDGSEWIAIEPIPGGVEGETIPTRSFHDALAYDDDERQMVLVAGGIIGFATISETWAYTVLGWPCTTDGQCGVDNICVDNICCDKNCPEGCNDRNRPGTCAAYR